MIVIMIDAAKNTIVKAAFDLQIRVRVFLKSTVND